MKTTTQSLSNRSVGCALALISSAACGMNPFFTQAVVLPDGAGMAVSSAMFYRNLAATLVLMLPVIVAREGFRITVSQLWRLLLLGGLFAATTVAMVEGYKYMDGGAATVVQYSFPVFTPMLGFLIFRERFGWRVAVAVAMVMVGVTCLAGVFSGHAGSVNLRGVLIELASGLLMAFYLVLLPRAGCLDSMGSAKVTFYVFLFGCVLLALYAITQGGIQPHDLVYSAHGPWTSWPPVWVMLLLSGLVSSAFANITLTMSTRLIGGTLCSILNVMEPVTAMVLGVLFLGDEPDVFTVIGTVIVIVAVLLIVLPEENKQ